MSEVRAHYPSPLRIPRGANKLEGGGEGKLEKYIKIFIGRGGPGGSKAIFVELTYSNRCFTG